MNKVPTDLAIISPAFGSVATGAAVYYRTIASALAHRGYSVTVLSERGSTVPPETTIRYVGFLPRRSSLRKQRFAAPMLYSAQNVAYFALPVLLSKLRPNTVLVHSSFFNWPGSFPAVIRLARATVRARFVLDVRDRLLRRPDATRPSLFDGIVSCSRNVTAHLGVLGTSNVVYEIPIPQEPLAVTSVESSDFRAKHDLTAPYILYIGMVKELKRIDLLLDAFSDYIRPLYPEMELVVAGMLKTNNVSILTRLGAPGVRYLGPLSTHQAHAAIAGAQLVVNLSPNEGMPRSSLEALALGARVALPPSVPEFEQYCPDHVVTESAPSKIARRLLELISRPPPAYPIEAHLPESVLDRYIEALFATR